MSEEIITIRHLRKQFSYLNPDPNANDGDMWVAYLLGFLGKSNALFAARRGTFVALDDVNLGIRRSEFVAILGPNGAGKTTLVKILATLLTPSSGQVIVNGFDVSVDPARVRASISVVPAAGWLAFDGELTLIENLNYWGRLYGLDRQTVEKRAREAVDVVGLRDWWREKPSHLSSGMRQRLAVAKGLLFRAPVFILDEPTANVEPVGAIEIRDFLRVHLNRELGQTVVLTTHNLAEAEQLADRVVIVDQGRIVACDHPSALLADLRGRVVDVTVNADPEPIARDLRSRGLALHVVDSRDDRGVSHLRLLLRSGVDLTTVRGVVEKGGVSVIRAVETQPVLEDFIRMAKEGHGGNERRSSLA